MTDETGRADDWPRPHVDRVYEPVWQCIYCGATPENLGKEHIVPLGMGGTYLLPRASCRRCETVTSRFEGLIQRGLMWNVRAIRKIQSRNPDSMPTETEVVIVRDGEEGAVTLPIEDAPVLLHLPVFAPPSSITGDKTDGAIAMRRIVTILYGTEPEEVREDLGAEEIRVTGSYRPVAFARLIAKIGYSYAVAELGLDAFDEIYLLPDLLGERDQSQIGRWVGTHPDRPLAPNGPGLHRIALIRQEDRGEIWAEVQLFSDGPTPSYLVIVGRAA